MSLEQIKEINYADLRFRYIDSGASSVAATLESIRSGSAGPLRLSHPTDEMVRSGMILFSPFRKLLRFYGLLEIALTIKFIPEPNYDDKFWKGIAVNLSLPVIRWYEESNYPVVLPQFLLGRLEGRSHLEEEGAEERYDEASALFSSFATLISRWENPDIEVFLRYAMSAESDSDQLDAFINLVANKNEFIARILAARSERNRYEDLLLSGFSGILVLCEDLDRLLEEAGDFRLLQSAMWNYHADLFLLAGGRLPSYLYRLVAAFEAWCDGESSDEATASVGGYIRDAKKLIERLSSGIYGNNLSQAPLVAPLAPALA